MTDEPRSMTEVLAGLPQHDPPPHLWTRILETRLEQERQARRRTLFAGVAAVVATVMLAAGLYFRMPATDPERGSDPLPELIAHSQVLEAQLRTIQGQAAPLETAQRTRVSQQQARLLQLDEALSQAYQDQASDEELAALWRQRAQLITEMLGTYRQPSGAQPI